MFICLGVEANILKQNSYGTLQEQSNGLVFISGAYRINIDPDLRTQSMYFSDGSYIKIDPSRSLITRYSAKTNSQESASLSVGFSTRWNVAVDIVDAVESFDNFSNSPNANQPPIEHCYNGEIVVPCSGTPFFTLGELQAKNIVSTTQNFASSSSCSAESNDLEYRGYNGHSSLFRCALTSGIGLFTTAVGVLTGCVLEPTKVGCPIAITAYAGAIVNHADTVLSCERSWDRAFDAWKTCTQNSGGSGSGSGGFGFGSGFGSDSDSSGGPRGGSSGSMCRETRNNSVCTAGGCNSYQSSELVPCP
jgi:hypothetical protein